MLTKVLEVNLKLYVILMFSIGKKSFRGIILIVYEVIKSTKYKTIFFVLLTPFEYFYFGHLEPQW